MPTQTTYQSRQGNIQRQHVYERACASIQLVMTDNCGNTGSDCRYWWNHYLEMTAVFYYFIICPCLVFGFCSMVMMHVYVLFCFVSNHFYNTHEPHLLATLTPAGLKSTESCILEVFKVHCVGELLYSVHLIIFT